MLRNNDDWHALAEAMREELRECAWLLGLMDSQQRAILSREPEALDDVTRSIDEQGAQIERLAADRDQLMAQVYAEYVGSGDLNFDKLTRAAPLPMRGLFAALQDEGLKIRQRLERRSRQNYGLLKRAQALGGELLEAMKPSRASKTYTRAGTLKNGASISGSVVRTAV